MTREPPKRRRCEWGDSSLQASDFQWEASTLSEEDERLIGAYGEVGVPLDSLAYSDAFEELLDKAGFRPGQHDNPTDEERHKRFKQLLNLRKRGRLPRVPPSSVER